MAKAAEYKKKVIKGIVDLASQYPIIAAINMENLPAPQLQKMRAELRGKVVLTMTKRRLIKLAFEEAKKGKKGIEQLSQHLGGMPALMFSKENPFKLYKILQKNKSPAPAKANQTALKDIVIPAGPTPFAPGPVIGELAQAGIKSGVEGGKVAIKEDSVVAKKGEKIKPKVAEILTRLGVQPMEVGLDLVAAYEDGTIYTSDVLAIDEVEFMNKLQSAASGAFNVAMFAAYPAKSTIEQLIFKAAKDAKALGVSQNIIDKGMIDALLGKAEGSMMGLKSAANIEVTVKEKPKEEKKVEEPKPEVKTEEKPIEKEIKKEEPIRKEPICEKPIEKKEIKETKEEIKPEPIKEKPLTKEPIEKEIKKEEKPKVEEKPKEEIKPIEKKEIKALEEEKKIIKEEKKLEKQKPIEVPVEREVQKAVKEEEEKQLEKERIDKEKEIEKIEKQKAEEKAEEDETAKKVAEMVAKTKKFGKQPTAEQLVEDVKKEVKKEKKPVKKEIRKKKEIKKETVKDVPSVQELAEKKKQEEKKNDMESAEQLLEKLKKKGTLRE